jgi:signal transduction histidine kinase
MSIGLLVSILIRILAFCWSLWLLHRIRDWRMGFLSIMLSLMALRQILTLKARFTSMTPEFSGLATEWPGIIVSLMAFLAVYFLGNMLAERKRISTEQEKLIAELEIQNAELERFTYTISHDLKTPLVTINGFVGYLREHFQKGDLEAFDEDLGKIKQATANMEQTLNELLQLARVGRAVSPFEKINLKNLTDAALEKLQGQITGRRLNLRVQPGMHEVFADRSRLLEVLVILIDNALKFTMPRDSAEIEIGSRVDADEAVYYVRDNGPGIDPRYHEYVFGLFDRIDSGTEGSGVGLALAKRIIELHHGRIWVESDGDGNGSTFLFALPAVATELENNNQAAAGIREPGLRGLPNRRNPERSTQS